MCNSISVRVLLSIALAVALFVPLACAEEGSDSPREGITVTKLEGTVWEIEGSPSYFIQFDLDGWFMQNYPGRLKKGRWAQQDDSLRVEIEKTTIDATISAGKITGAAKDEDGESWTFAAIKVKDQDAEYVVHGIYSDVSFRVYTDYKDLTRDFERLVTSVEVFANDAMGEDAEPTKSKRLQTFTATAGTLWARRFITNGRSGASWSTVFVVQMHIDPKFEGDLAEAFDNANASLMKQFGLTEKDLLKRRIQIASGTPNVWRTLSVWPNPSDKAPMVLRSSGVGRAIPPQQPVSLPSETEGSEKEKTQGNDAQ